ncbi:HAD family hydrolase [Streptomyces alkaliterrae]|uniref:HAD family hydrolase n=1 Tax=Streptomyces alkaliterrae TaxID=2213162 RepID=A0A5P0YWH8_9ACTN|nr:HAD family hydrolase [Streptomyces alkaliterrae]MBB1256560.1 HAD family hydrolase [Streptomyces alkaliterrae]MBB1262089.1 HAD family hydrolase [Streptomyces alkaliterrae]MQS04636.1 HAD hydrolase-like protein [Streptomyces alkaliterrae]
MPTDPVATAATSADTLLFDFDGPICNVFAGVPAPGVARELTRLVTSKDEAAGRKAAETDDPIEVLRIADAADVMLGQEVERALTAAEIRAVAVAGPPTPGSVDALRAAAETGRNVAVVSNNSGECVAAFLDRHGLRKYVVEIVGRPADQLHQMKPEPYPLLQAASLLDVDISTCVLVGDSVTDIQAAHAAGADVIGYANKPHKHEAFAASGASAITDHMQAVADALIGEQNA